MNCKNCPYIKNDYDRIVNMIDDDIEDESLLSYCWCEKIGGKLWRYGTCGEKNTSHTRLNNKSNKKRRSKIERDTKYKNKIKYIRERNHDFPADPIDINGCYIYSDDYYIRFPEETHDEFAYYKRRYRSSGRSGRSRYLKSVSNKKVRRYRGEIHNGGHYRKIFDYWYEMY